MHGSELLLVVVPGLFKTLNSVSRNG